MGNTLLTPDIIAKEALHQFENSLVFANVVDRQYVNEFVKVGDTVRIRRRVQFDVTDGAVVDLQDVTEGNTNIVVDQRKHVAWEFDTQDLTLDIEDYSVRYIQPAMIKLANKVDTDLAGLYKYVNNTVGTPGSTPSTFAALAAAAQRLDEIAVPEDGRVAVLTPSATWAIANEQKSLYVTDKARTAFEKATLGEYANFMTYKSNNIRRHLTGAHGGTPRVDGANQNVTYDSVKTTMTQTLITDGWTTSSGLKAGDVFTIADVYDVNPVTKEALPYAKQFTVVSNVTTNSNASNDTNLTIYPAIITSGPYQTCSAVPANDALITYVGTASTLYPQNMCFHRDAFSLAMVPLAIPEGTSFAKRMSRNGLSVRVIKDYDFINDREMIRLDILYGVKATNPDLACRLTG